MAESVWWRYEYTCGACGNQFEVGEHPNATPPCPDCGAPDTFDQPNMYRCKDCDSEFEVYDPPENPPPCDGCGGCNTQHCSEPAWHRCVNCDIGFSTDYGVTDPACHRCHNRGANVVVVDFLYSCSCEMCGREFEPGTGQRQILRDLRSLSLCRAAVEPGGGGTGLRRRGGRGRPLREPNGTLWFGARARRRRQPSLVPVAMGAPAPHAVKAWKAPGRRRWRCYVTSTVASCAATNLNENSTRCQMTGRPAPTAESPRQSS